MVKRSLVWSLVGVGMGTSKKRTTHRLFHELSGCTPEQLMGKNTPFLTAEGIGFVVKVHTVHFRKEHHFLLFGTISDLQRHGAQPCLHGALALSTAPFPYGAEKYTRIGVVLVREGSVEEGWFDRSEVAWVFAELARWESEMKLPLRNRLLREAVTENNVVELQNNQKEQ